MYEDKTPEGIKAEILAGLTGLDCREGSYIDTLVSPIAYEIWKYYTALEAVEPILFVDTSSGAYIDRRCADYGILRKPGTKSAAVMTFSGDEGTVIPPGKAFATKEGLTFLLAAAVTLEHGTGAGLVEAEEAGTQYNVGDNQIVIQSISLPGLSGWTNTAAKGGTDRETDAELIKRLYDRLRNPATSGNIAHYKAWAMETAGVGNCRVLPLWSGPGTVKLVIADSNGEPASSQIVEDCKAHVEEMRPVGAAVTVEAAEAVPIAVSASLTLDGAVTWANVKTKFETALDDYLKSIAFETDRVPYSRIAYLLLEIGGVRDYSALTVNGGTANIPLTDVQVPVKGVITLAAD